MTKYSFKPSPFYPYKINHTQPWDWTSCCPTWIECTIYAQTWFDTQCYATDAKDPRIWKRVLGLYVLPIRFVPHPMITVYPKPLPSLIMALKELYGYKES